MKFTLSTIIIDLNKLDNAVNDNEFLFFGWTGKNAAQVEAHEKWYQNLQRLRKEQRQELDEWKRQKKTMDEEERKRAAEESLQDETLGDPWVAQWRRQRVTVRQQLQQWKVFNMPKISIINHTMSN